MVGFSDQEAHVKLYSQTSPSAEILGETVITPDRVELKYAALGDDSTRQAILAIEADQRQTTLRSRSQPSTDGSEPRTSIAGASMSCSPAGMRWRSQFQSVQPPTANSSRCCELAGAEQASTFRMRGISGCIKGS